jgi:DnaK suppressor protein
MVMFAMRQYSGFMRHSRNEQYLCAERLDAYKFKLTVVLERLTSGHRNEQGNAAGRVAEPPIRESTNVFCGKNLIANRMEWTDFLTRQVSEALKRIDNGDYGACLQCGQLISAKRLAALPWVTLCSTCQERESAGGLT